MPSADKKNRILTSYYRPKPGGLCKRLFRLIEHLLISGHEVHYLSVVKFPIEHENCYFHHLPWPKKYTESRVFWLWFHLASPIVLFYIGLKYKITHCFVFSTNYAFVLQPFCKFKSVPLTLFLRGDAIENHRIKGRNSLLLMIEKWIEAIAIYKISVFGVSNALVEQVVRRHKVSKPESFGVVRNDIKLKYKTDKKNIKKPIRLVCAGVLEDRKNQKLLIKCMQSLSPIDATLYFYGVGPKEFELKSLTQDLNLEEKIKFMGWVDSSIIWKNTDLLLQPSLHEGAPNSVLEALENGIPVVASSIPEHREILPEKYLLEINDIESWIKQINIIAKSPVRILNKIANDQRVCAKKLCFDWEYEMTNKIIT